MAEPATNDSPEHNDTGTGGDGSQEGAEGREDLNQQQQESQEGDTPPEGQKEQGEEGEKPSGEIQDFTMPEGFELNTEVAGELKTFAQENGLNQDQAQSIADLGVKMLQQQQDSFAQLRQDWEKQSREDKEFGGEKFDENLSRMNKALGQFATPEFISFLEESGLGQHPEMLRTWHRIAEAVGEDRLVTGSTGGMTEKSLEARLYPDMTK